MILIDSNVLSYPIYTFCCYRANILCLTLIFTSIYFVASSSLSTFSFIMRGPWFINKGVLEFTFHTMPFRAMLKKDFERLIRFLGILSSTMTFHNSIHMILICLFKVNEDLVKCFVIFSAFSRMICVIRNASAFFSKPIQTNSFRICSPHR